MTRIWLFHWFFQVANGYWISLWISWIRECLWHSLLLGKWFGWWFKNKNQDKPSMPRKRHRAINLDKPKVDAGCFWCQTFHFYRDFWPVWGKQRAHLGQARCPTWASTLPHLGTFAARMLPISPHYCRICLCLCLRQKPTWSYCLRQNFKSQYYQERECVNTRKSN